MCVQIVPSHNFSCLRYYEDNPPQCLFLSFYLAATYILYSFFLLLPSPSFLGRYLMSISTSFSDTGYSHLFTATEFVHQHSIPAFTRKGRFPCRFVVLSVFFASSVLLLFPSALLFSIICTVLLPSRVFFISSALPCYFFYLFLLFPLLSPSISNTFVLFLCPPLLLPPYSRGISSAPPLLFPSTFSYYFLCPPLLFLPSHDISSALSFTLFCSFLDFSHYFSAAITFASSGYFLYPLLVFPLLYSTCFCFLGSRVMTFCTFSFIALIFLFHAIHIL
jgi:hypothetical protein